MITKAILAEKILRKLNGGDFNLSSSKVKKQDVYLEMEAAYGYVVQKYINQYGEDVTSEFVSTYPDVLVQKDSQRDKLYSVLPAQLVSLSGGKGVRQVSGVKDEFDVFIPINSGDDGLFYGLEAGPLSGKKVYWLEGNKIFYKNISPLWEGESVMIKMISSIYSLGEDDYIPIPAGVETDFEDNTFSRLVLQRDSKEDKLADNNASA